MIASEVAVLFSAPEWVRLREVPAVDAEPAALVLVDQPMLGGHGQCGGRFGLLGTGATA